MLGVPKGNVPCSFFFNEHVACSLVGNSTLSIIYWMDIYVKKVFNTVI